jgi:hypothetical protein
VWYTLKNFHPIGRLQKIKQLNISINEVVDSINEKVGKFQAWHDVVEKT